MRELRKDHSLAYCVSSEIGLKAEGFNGGDLNLESVEWRARLRLLEDHVCSSSNQYIIYSLNSIVRAIDLC